MSTSPRLRCAVYTRKSTEEGLDQEFNSLDAQFEACAAYIASQVGLGWKLIAERYDDGGISGGTMERPALQRLLEDIRDRRVDVVVVYKIDRLTRSLMDFSRIVEVFDQHGVSFVSVTQQFNTTTSMGRLTLNVLLSFAQFEREVTAERIRDKIAASKKKGMWMGGIVPLGYRVENRKLLVDAEEAATVRWLFEKYLELKSVRALVEEAQSTQLHGRTRTTHKGTRTLTTTFGKGNLYHLLSNPIYISKIRHRDKTYDGEHLPLIDAQAFAAAQELLKTQAPRRPQLTNNRDSHLLTGILFDEAGRRLRSVHAKTRGLHYRYYVSQDLVDARKRQGSNGWRLPAQELDSLVEVQLRRILRDQTQLSDWIQRLAPDADLGSAFEAASHTMVRLADGDVSERRSIVRTIFKRVVLATGSLTLEVDLIGVMRATEIEPDSKRVDPDLPASTITCPISLRRRGVELRMVLSDGSDADRRKPDPALIDLIMRARRYLGSLTDGSERSLTDVAAAEATDLSEVSRLLPLAFLSPTIIERILQGGQPANLNAQFLSRLTELPISWSEQHRLILG